MSMTDNGLIDLANAFRKYIPGILTGGNKNGFTEAEKEELKKNLAKADEIAAGKTSTGYANDVLEMLGLKGADSSMLLIIGVLVVAFIAIIKD
jgi:hypothetical protein